MRRYLSLLLFIGLVWGKSLKLVNTDGQSVIIKPSQGTLISLPTTEIIDELHSKCFTDKHMYDPAPPNVRSTLCSLVSIPSYANEATINSDFFDI